MQNSQITLYIEYILLDILRGDLTLTFHFMLTYDVNYAKFISF